MHDAPECSGVVTTEPLVGALPGTIVKHARGLTNASRYSQSGSPGEGVGTGLYRPHRASVLKSGGK